MWTIYGDISDSDLDADLRWDDLTWEDLWGMNVKTAALIQGSSINIQPMIKKKIKENLHYVRSKKEIVDRRFGIR